MSEAGVIFKPEQIRDVVRHAFDGVGTVHKGGKKGSDIYDCPCSFDIETSSFYVGDEKRACMYEWTLGLNGMVIIGRHWDEFEECMEVISEMLELGPERKRLVIYVRNLAYEFQFIMRRFDFTKVFALSSRKPVQAITSSGIEFRCSYLLTGYSLAMSGKLLNKYKVEKKVGDLDYNLMRHPGTDMTKTELGYCVYDVLVDMACIQEKIENDGNIARIPLTKTGYVREYMRNCCLYDDSGNHEKNTDKYHYYRWIMDSLTLTPETYQLAKRVFQGGFTHTSAWREGRVIYNVGSKDETSAYPYQVVESDRFPMSSPEYYPVTGRDDFRKQLACYACMFDIKIYGLKASNTIDHPLGLSRCWESVHAIVDNGRVASADYVLTSMTELDFDIMEQYYTYDRIEVGNFHRMIRGRLPKDFVRGMLTMYDKKTELKDVKGREVEYMRSKEDANSCYGMMVMDPVREEQVFEDGVWLDPVVPDLTDAIEKENKNKKRFTYYLWGVYVTALNRHRVLSVIRKIGDDYCYTDTDSIKYTHPERYEDMFTKLNTMTVESLQRAMKEQGLPVEMCFPKTIKGVEKPLGVWDTEHPYDRAKFLRAKCYAVETDGDFNITVAGLNKKVTVPWMLEKFGGNDGAFEAFRDNLVIPPEHTGKLTHTYVDDPIDGILTDYRGVKGEYHELSYIHLEAGEYHLDLSDEFISYLEGLDLMME